MLSELKCSNSSVYGYSLLFAYYSLTSQKPLFHYAARIMAPRADTPQPDILRTAHFLRRQAFLSFQATYEHIYRAFSPFTTSSKAIVQSSFRHGLQASDKGCISPQEGPTLSWTSSGTRSCHAPCMLSRRTSQPSSRQSFLTSTTISSWICICESQNTQSTEADGSQLVAQVAMASL